MRLKVLVLLSIAFASTVSAQAPAGGETLRQDLEGALRGCEIWILDPSSWLDDPVRFLAAVGLGKGVYETESLPEVLLPPQPFRRPNRYWRIDTGSDDGYALVVSRDIPMCHITGGGEIDFHPAAASVVASPEVVGRWERTGEERHDGIVTTLFRLREEPKLSLVFSRADAPDARRDRVQVLVTATYDLNP